MANLIMNSRERSIMLVSLLLMVGFFLLSCNNIKPIKPRYLNTDPVPVKAVVRSESFIFDIPKHDVNYVEYRLTRYRIGSRWMLYDYSVTSNGCRLIFLKEED